MLHIVFFMSLSFLVGARIARGVAESDESVTFGHLVIAGVVVLFLACTIVAVVRGL